MENGSVVLASTNGNLTFKPVDKTPGLVQVTITDPIPAIDRQHTTEAFRVALKNPGDYPHLSAYIKNPKNTICVRMIRCTLQDALRRCVATNSGQKKWTPVETLTAMILDAKHNEKQGIESHTKERPSLVMFQFAYNASKDKEHPLHDLLPVDPGIKTDAKKTRTNLSVFLDAMWPLQPILEKEYEGYKGMTINEQAEVVKKLTLPYWSKLKEFLPNAFGDQWYNYNTFRKAAPLLAECFNGFVRVWLEHRDKKSTIPFLAAIKGKTLEQFCEDNIPNALSETDAALPWKNEDYWIIPGGGFMKTYDNGAGDFEPGQDGTCKYLWSTLRPNGVGKTNWTAFIRTIQGHATKLRYNERKGAASADVMKKRRKKTTAAPVAAEEAA
jgi:hypothetical protein